MRDRPVPPAQRCRDHCRTVRRIEDRRSVRWRQDAPLGPRATPRADARRRRPPGLHGAVGHNRCMKWPAPTPHPEIGPSPERAQGGRRTCRTVPELRVSSARVRRLVPVPRSAARCRDSLGNQRLPHRPRRQDRQRSLDRAGRDRGCRLSAVGAAPGPPEPVSGSSSRTCIPVESSTAETYAPIASRNSRGPGCERHGVNVRATSDKMAVVRSELVARAICNASRPTVAASSGWPLRASAAARRAPNRPVSRRDRLFPARMSAKIPDSTVHITLPSRKVRVERSALEAWKAAHRDAE